MRKSLYAPVAQVVDRFSGAALGESPGSDLSPQHREHLGIEQLRSDEIRLLHETADLQA
jgi:hypothetical protein